MLHLIHFPDPFPSQAFISHQEKSIGLQLSNLFFCHSGPVLDRGPHKTD